jgi:large subunit ribosomal protein L1
LPLTTKKNTMTKGKKTTSAKTKTAENITEFDKMLSYPIEKAIEMTREMSKTKFDASVEVHFRLGIDPKKGEQQIRTAVSLPHGTGKSVKVAAFVTPEKEAECKKAGADFVGSEELIAEIKKTEKTDFQVAVAEPAMMRHIAKIAKILGTRGLMPSPKSETVTPDPAKAITELKKGKISFKNDDTGNVHITIGKVSFDEKKILENYETILGLIKKIKPAKVKGIYIRNITLTSSMGPGIKVDID